MAQQEVFISYAWGGESEQVAEEIEKVLNGDGFRLVRDKTDLGFKGLIREFMEKIGQGNLVVLVISDRYLKSKNCMFELLEVAKKGELHSRVFPVVLPDADIYDSLGIIDYLKYWDQKIRELNARVKELDNLADTRKVQEDINLYTDIRATIDDLAGHLGNMNTLTLDTMRASKFQPLLVALHDAASPAAPRSTEPSRKEGKVLYHIPNMMQLNAWTRCTIRLAWEEIYLTAGLKTPKDQLQIESIRLAEVMQVALSEGKEGHNFEIKALSNEEQFIFEDDFTEWLYDVKALAVGNFTLVLRITLIHLINGQERKKDLVLEREVTTETFVPKALPKFETAEEGLSRATAQPMDSLFPELAEEYAAESLGSEEIPHIPPSFSKKVDSPIPSQPFPRTSIDQSGPSTPPARKDKSAFRRILPYAASVFGIVVAALLVFQQNESSPPELSQGYPTSPSVENPLPSTPLKEDQMLVAFTLDATGPQGAQVKEVLVFAMEEISLDSLEQVRVEGYHIKLIPASDTVGLKASVIKNLTIQEMKDSMKIISQKPIRVGNKIIDRKALKIKESN